MSSSEQYFPLSESVGPAQPIDEKKRKRLERNRESARECRRRKKNKLLKLKQQIAHFEADNLQLRLKLQVGPESAKKQDDESNELTVQLEQMINEGASESEIKKFITDLQEKYADYGRDRRSAIAFHISQLQRCLQSTQTTRTILWLFSIAPSYYHPDGSEKFDDDDEVARLWRSAHAAISPSREQCRQLVELASRKTTTFPIKAEDTSTDSPSDSDVMLSRLHELVSAKNESLDLEMNEVQSILSASQSAKFILWIKQNPAVIQMLEALWPHLTQSSNTDD